MASQQKRYPTGLIPLSGEAWPGTIRGRGWQASLELIAERSRRSIGDHEIVLTSKHQATAEKALQLILQAHRLARGEPPALPIEDDQVRLVADGDSIDPDDPLASLGTFGGFSTGGLPLACRLAAKASQRQTFVYALALFRQSQELHGNWIVDLDPRNYPQQIRSPFPQDHVRFAYAIITAYAVLEELSFALASGPVYTRNRRWVPEKRRDLEGRLRRAGVDVSRPFPLDVRGGRTSIELNRSLTPFTPAEWARSFVRDGYVHIVDAIAYARWLRSTVSAHRIDKRSALLSVHDVSNAQRLARWLLLDALGVDR